MSDLPGIDLALFTVPGMRPALALRLIRGCWVTLSEQLPPDPADVAAGGMSSVIVTSIIVLIITVVALIGVLYQSRKSPRRNHSKGDSRPEFLMPIRPEPVVSRGVTGGIFISYRRQDEPNFAGRLYDRLVARFGKDIIFMDVDSIELGLDFVEVINRSLSQCKVLVVVIGKNWLRVADVQGQPRLKNSNDYVRIEIETALRRGIRVIPILVEGASVPKGSELPDSMEALSRRNGTEISHARFNVEADQLVNTLQRILKVD